jgi:hypothetical protein
MPRIPLRFTEKTVIKKLLSVVSVKSVYLEESNHDLRNTLLEHVIQ